LVFALPHGGEEGDKTPSAAGSTIHIHGKKIAREYFEKSQKKWIIVSIRGMVASLVKSPPNDAIASALGRVKISYDYLAPYFYQDVRMIRWLRSRAVPNPNRCS
jgi:hypothetical protein